MLPCFSVFPNFLSFFSPQTLSFYYPSLSLSNFLLFLSFFLFSPLFIPSFLNSLSTCLFSFPPFLSFHILYVHLVPFILFILQLLYFFLLLLYFFSFLFFLLFLSIFSCFIFPFALFFLSSFCLCISSNYLSFLFPSVILAASFFPFFKLSPLLLPHVFFLSALSYAADWDVRQPL